MAGIADFISRIQPIDFVGNLTQPEQLRAVRMQDQLGQMQLQQMMQDRARAEAFRMRLSEVDLGDPKNLGQVFGAALQDAPNMAGPISQYAAATKPNSSDVPDIVPYQNQRDAIAKMIEDLPPEDKRLPLYKQRLTELQGVIDKKSQENSTQQEGYLKELTAYKMKKDQGLRTTPEEDIRARTIYEFMTAPKALPDGTIIQPRLSLGGMFEGGGGGAAPRSPYDTSPRQSGRVTVTPGAKPTEKLYTDVEQLSEDLQKNKVPQILTSVRELNDNLSKFTASSVPGIGYGKNTRIANLFLSEKGKTIKSQAQAVANDLLNMYSGLAVTVPEEERRTLEMMRSGEFSAKDFYNAWPLVVKRLNSISGNIKSGAAPEVLAEYGKRPGAANLQPIQAATGKRAARQPANYRQEDLEFTAKKHGISVEEVKRRMGIK